MLTVGANPQAMDASRNLGLTQARLGQNLAKLSSGSKINSAADNPAAMVISEQMRAQIGSLGQEIRNTDHAINKYNTADHAIGQLQDSLVQLRSMAVGAANGGLNDEASSAAYETAARDLVASYNRNVESAQFGSQQLLDGSAEAVADVERLTEVDLSTPEAAQASIEKIDQALEDLGQAQGEIGAKVANGLESTRNTLSVTLQNLTAAESTIRDTDYAQESAKLVRNILLQNSGIAMLTHANQSVSGVLGLLD